MERSVRLHRSELAVPGSNARMLEKAPTLGADVVMLDLEDAVAPDDKADARTNVIDALRELDWSGPSVSLRSRSQRSPPPPTSSSSPRCWGRSRRRPTSRT
jgi:HpcH/HpaI aldolase/citrate lyase family